MTEVWQSLVKLGLTAYLLFGGYTLFVGFLEKNKKKKIAGALILILPTAALILLLVLLAKKYGA